MEGYTATQIKQLCKDRTPEQKKVIKYFLGGGCLSHGMSDEAYEQIIYAKAHSRDFKQKALDKLGLELEQVSAIEPVHFEGYVLGDKNALVKSGKDRVWRSSKYHISWLFFSETQVYVYQYTFSTVEDGVSEKTEEYFYQDITNFSHTSDTVEKVVVDKINCVGKPSYSHRNIVSDRFELIVPGDKFCCSMMQSEYIDKTIRAMKALLRDKKNQ